MGLFVKYPAIIFLYTHTPKKYIRPYSILSSMPQNNLINSVIIITGAASGIGRELALLTAAGGASVIATDKNAGGLEETKLLGKNKGVSITTALLDVSDKDAIGLFAKETVSVLNGRKLILINNAGVALSSGTFQHTSLEDFEWLININLWGAIRLTKAFYPYFIQHNNGHIVNISSVFGLIGVATNIAYCTSKFGIRGFTESLRMELQGTNVFTTCVHPGGIKTNIVRNALVKTNTITAEMHSKSIESFEKFAMTTPYTAAQQILNAIEKRKRRIVIGADGKAIDIISRLFPVAYTSILYKQLKKTFGI